MRSLGLVILFAAAPAFGQVAADGSQPVDQAVGDLDPLSTSLRVVEPGLGQFNRDSALRRLPEGAGLPLGLPSLPEQPTYVYEAPGVRAYVQRPEYLTYNPEAGGVALNAAPAVDGMYRPLVPAGVIYDLTGGEAIGAPRPTPDPGWTDHRIGTRIHRLGSPPLNTRLDPRLNVDGLGNANLGPTHAMNGLSPGAYWRQRREAERRAMELPIEALFPQASGEAPETDVESSAPSPEPRSGSAAEPSSRERP